MVYTIQIKTFALPFLPQQHRFADDELRQFLHSHSAIQKIDYQYAIWQNIPHYFVFVIYHEYENLLQQANSNNDNIHFTQNITEKNDENRELNPRDLKLYTLLKEWRHGKAKQEKLPAYVYFHNKQLVTIAQIKPITKSGLLKVQGIGKIKVNKYGEDIIKIVKDFQKENNT